MPAERDANRSVGNAPLYHRHHHQQHLRGDRPDPQPRRYRELRRSLVSAPVVPESEARCEAVGQPETHPSMLWKEAKPQHHPRPLPVPPSQRRSPSTVPRLPRWGCQILTTVQNEQSSRWPSPLIASSPAFITICLVRFPNKLSQTCKNLSHPPAGTLSRTSGTP